MLGQVYQQKEHAISTKSWKSVANVTVIGVDTGKNLFHVVGSIVATEVAAKDSGGSIIATNIGLRRDRKGKFTMSRTMPHQTIVWTGACKGNFTALKGAP